jgi:hypothetical protein
LPDGVAVNVEAGHIYWTNMGSLARNDGSIERVDLDGGNRTTIVPEGVIQTPKQLQLDKRNGKLYWCDREGKRVMRANLDSSSLKTLVQTGSAEADSGDQTNGALALPSTSASSRSTGHRKARTTADSGASSAPASTFRAARAPKRAATSS